MIASYQAQVRVFPSFFKDQQCTSKAVKLNFYYSFVSLVTDFAHLVLTMHKTYKTTFALIFQEKQYLHGRQIQTQNH